MKYCPYCGAVLVDGAASFCADCGKSLPERHRPGQQKTPSLQTELKREPKPHKLRKVKQRRLKTFQTENLLEFPEDQDDGYDGYYDDVPTEDDGHVRERLEPGLIKKIALVGGGVVVIIALAIFAMNFI